MMKPRNQVMEKRHLRGEMRAIEGEGIVTAYLTKWGTVDSYGTSFVKGSFKKTFQERGNKIRVLYNHEDLAGKLLEAREDDIGPWVKIQLNLDTRTGAETFAHIKAGDIDCFSFGFNRIQSRVNGEVTEITEVRVAEVSPVVFEANSEAKVTGIRAEDFNETLDESLMVQKGWKLWSALEQTLDDIRWNNKNPEDIISKTDTAIAEFHMAYIQWLTDFFAMFQRSDDQDPIAEIRKSNTGNVIKAEMRSHDPEKLAKTTSLTEEEIKTLNDGKLLQINRRSKLDELPASIKEAHQQHRREVVSTLCDELRSSGFSEIERLRFTSLLGISKTKEANSDGKDMNLLIKTIDSWNL